MGESKERREIREREVGRKEKEKKNTFFKVTFSFV